MDEVLPQQLQLKLGVVYVLPLSDEPSQLQDWCTEILTSFKFYSFAMIWTKEGWSDGRVEKAA
jgi:hypothetical protein